MCIQHSFGDNYCASVGADGWTSALGERENWSQDDRRGTGVCELMYNRDMSLSHELYRRVGLAALRFPDRFARVGTFVLEFACEVHHVCGKPSKIFACCGTVQWYIYVSVQNHPAF